MYGITVEESQALAEIDDRLLTREKGVVGKIKDMVGGQIFNTRVATWRKREPEHEEFSEQIDQQVYTPCNQMLIEKSKLEDKQLWATINTEFQDQLLHGVIGAIYLQDTVKRIFWDEIKDKDDVNRRKTYQQIVKICSEYSGIEDGYAAEIRDNVVDRCTAAFPTVVKGDAGTQHEFTELTHLLLKEVKGKSWETRRKTYRLASESCIKGVQDYLSVLRQRLQ